ncbi:MAG TPA: LOG family protein [Phycisphaerales bacterium]|nr:LOG family protein [Phycisphaerales bacterium]
MSSDPRETRRVDVVTPAPSNDTEVPAAADAPPERPVQKRADDPAVQQAVDDLIGAVCLEAPEQFDQRLVREAITACLKLIPDGRDTGELKLLSAAIKELRYAFRVFSQYPEPLKCTIFGSARTPDGHPDYDAAVEFGTLIAQAGWMVITGAGGGIMKAGHVGPGKTASFGVAIRLPFETTANPIIAGDEKLIHFRYFFTRKLMFLFHADAVVLFPGGFGTLDEAFETLTLVQTGKAAMMPIVLVEGVNPPGARSYWEHFDSFVRGTLLERGMISPEDLGLYYIAPSPAHALGHIQRFYRNYHSSRYVRDDLVIRLRRELRDEDVERLNDEFGVLVKKGRIRKSGPLETEGTFPDLPRIVFTHTRYKFGLVRALIDRINELEPLP